MCVCIDIDIHVFISICPSVDLPICVCLCVYVYTITHDMCVITLYACMHACMHACVCMSVYTSVYSFGADVHKHLEEGVPASRIRGQIFAQGWPHFIPMGKMLCIGEPVPL